MNDIVNIIRCSGCEYPWPIATWMATMRNNRSQWCFNGNRIIYCEKCKSVPIQSSPLHDQYLTSPFRGDYP